MDRIQEGEKEADRHSIDFGLLDQVDKFLDRVWRQVFQDIARVVDAFRQAKPKLPGGKGRRAVQIEVVKIGAALAADFQDVLKSQSGYQSGPAAFAFQKGVGGNRRTVNEIRLCHARLRHPSQDTLSRIVGGRWQLMHGQPPAPQDRQVGKSATDIDANDSSRHRK